MKYKNLFWGVVLILLGVLYLLKKFDMIWFNWKDLLSLWPLLLVLWGISLLPIKSLFKLIASFVAVLVMILLIWANPGRFHNGWLWIGHKEYTEKAEMNRSESLNDDAKYASLELDAAAGSYVIKGTTHQLVDFKHAGDSGTYYMRTSSDEDMQHVRIGPESRRNQFSIYNSHEVDIKLNPELIWDLDIDAGAADIEIDLTEFIVRDFKINGGAASMEIKLGARSENLNLDIETGVSSVLIKVPKEVACEVNTNSFLVSKDLAGFDKVSKSTYVSPNFHLPKKTSI